MLLNVGSGGGAAAAPSGGAGGAAATEAPAVEAKEEKKEEGESHIKIFAIASYTYTSVYRKRGVGRRYGFQSLRLIFVSLFSPVIGDLHLKEPVKWFLA